VNADSVLDMWKDATAKVGGPDVSIEANHHMAYSGDVAK
jgi:hypothetical protein